MGKGITYVDRWFTPGEEWTGLYARGEKRSLLLENLRGGDKNILADSGSKILLFLGLGKDICLVSIHHIRV